METLQLLQLGEHGWGDQLLSGLWVTLRLALTSLPIGLALGFLVATVLMSRNRALKSLAIAYTTTLRGLPELLTLFIIYHGAGLLLRQVLNWINPDIGYVELSPFVAGVVALSLVFAAYSAEVIRGAWQALDKGQIEAAQAYGFSPWLVFRRIELPQIWRIALPGLGNLWINLIKDTALVSVIALNDLMRMAGIAVGATKQPFTFYLTVCLMYWLVCLSFEVLLGRAEKRASRGLKTLGGH
ncbi:MAG: ABC transporter permease [Saccharospirillum sp.]|nr:ABC transporter permease [Saccharospirillum sp.]